MVLRQSLLFSIWKWYHFFLMWVLMLILCFRTISSRTTLWCFWVLLLLVLLIYYWYYLFLSTTCWDGKWKSMGSKVIWNHRGNFALRLLIYYWYYLFGRLHQTSPSKIRLFPCFLFPLNLIDYWGFLIRTMWIMGGNFHPFWSEFLHLRYLVSSI